MADSALSRQKQKDIAGQFEKFEREEIGEGRHETFHEMMDELARIYLSAHAEVL